MSTRKGRPPGVLPVLQALVAGDDRFDVGAIDSSTIGRALHIGLGPALAYVGRDSPTKDSSHAKDIQAADLTARLLSAEMFEALEDVLRGANAVGCVPILLKGCSAALRYYAEPHLRTMGDIDVLVGSEELPGVESQLRRIGFEQKGEAPAARYERHHHSMPFWHPERHIWVEVHTRPFPPHSPLATDSRYSPDAMRAMLAPFDVGGQAARVMTHELQLVYTASRWSELLNLRRGAFPVLDAALLIRTQAALDWEGVCALANRSWAATALRLMLGYLQRSQLGAVPPAVLRRCAAGDRFTNRTVIDLLHRAVDAFVMDGREPGSLLTRRNLRIIWTTLAGPTPPRAKLAALPFNLLFPPRREGRSGLAEALRRMRRLLRSSRNSP